MRNKIEKIIQKFDLGYRYTGEVTDEILTLFLKEYEKRKPKKTPHTYGRNLTIDEFDEVIYKMCGDVNKPR